MIQFIIELSKNIDGIQIFVGEMQDIQKIDGPLDKDKNNNINIISKEHPAFTNYPGIKDERDWMFPNVNGYYSSFFSYWKKCQNNFKY